MIRTGPFFAAYQASGAQWVGLATGQPGSGVCNGLGIPPATAAQIGCT